MNKPILLLLIAVALLSSCSKKNTGNPLAPLLGTWHYNADTVRNYNGGVQTNIFTGNFTSADYLQFNSNGSGEEVLAGEDASGAPDVNTANFTFSIIANTLVLHWAANTYEGVTTNAYTETATIKKATSSVLELYFVSSFTNTDGSTGQVLETDYLGK